jgi:enamine deaminase RidA (YjgF/YER057c/UK114 family)
MMAKTAKRPGRRARSAAVPLKIAYGSEPGFPIFLAMREGDFIFTSAQGDHDFDLTAVVYDERGFVVSDGNALRPRSMAEETRSTLRNIEASLAEAGYTLDDVVDTSVWLRDPRDFHEMNKAYVRLPNRDQGDRLQAAGGKRNRRRGRPVVAKKAVTAKTKRRSRIRRRH